ncbi:MAG: type II toxin-antitoxin system VapC family toxin [Chloroflexi bacterium]|nr:type II toxin-antitoxin system VapC family toxin [Chloroflexota bacterium]
MAMKDILLDTNAYAAFKQGQAEIVDIVRRASRIGINSVIVGELLAGFAAGSRQAKNRSELQQFLAAHRVVLLTLDEVTADYYATVYSNLRSKGRPIPTNDMWIAASALQHGFAVCTKDGHFKHVDGILVGATTAELLLQ